MFDARRSTICDKSIGIKDDIIENILIIITFSCVEAILVGWLYCWGFCSTEAASVTNPLHRLGPLSHSNKQPGQSLGLKVLRTLSPRT